MSRLLDCSVVSVVTVVSVVCSVDCVVSVGCVVVSVVSVVWASVLVVEAGAGTTEKKRNI